MKPAANHQWLCSGILVLALALCLAGCAPKYYPPPPPPPPPAPGRRRLRWPGRCSTSRPTASICGPAPAWTAPRFPSWRRAKKWKKWGVRGLVPDPGQAGWPPGLGGFPLPLLHPGDPGAGSGSGPSGGGDAPPLPERLQPPPLPEPVQPPPLPEKPAPPAKPPAAKSPSRPNLRKKQPRRPRRSRRKPNRPNRPSPRKRPRRRLANRR